MLHYVARRLPVVLGVVGRAVEVVGPGELGVLAHHDLAGETAHGTFRDDLFFRLNVIHLTLPPLRDRREDIPLLVDHFLAHLTATRGKDVTALSAEASAALLGHDYPGNVRELHNAVEHAFVMCRGETIEVEEDQGRRRSCAVTRVDHFSQLGVQTAPSAAPKAESS